ncbi:Helicase loader DnaI [thiotrophic endosymbiont of Bathymodiolus puteoserpentis (Logatchev)]|nr:Helicase loader DnaI [thiotrophic endosymbiont of Bathymodiolus puteoserpentis (Logatchev)]
MQITTTIYAHKQTLLIVTDYRLNANHNMVSSTHSNYGIVTDYRLNANHNHKSILLSQWLIVTDYRLNANHNKHACKTRCKRL